MPVRGYEKFIELILRYLAAHSKGAPTREVYEACADRLGLTEADRTERLPRGNQATYHNRLSIRITLTSNNTLKDVGGRSS